MRVNIYTDEVTQRVEKVEQNGFVGVRFYLELPVTVPTGAGVTIHRGPFQHHNGEDDSAAVTFWTKPGKDTLRSALHKALALLDGHDATTWIDSPGHD